MEKLDGSTSKSFYPRSLSRAEKLGALPPVKIAKTVLYQGTKTIGFNKFVIQFYVQGQYILLHLLVLMQIFLQVFLRLLRLIKIELT